MLPDSKKHAKTAAQTEAIHWFGTSTSNDFSSYVDPSSHNDSGTCTTMSNRHTAQNKCHFNPLLSRRRFSQGERFCLPRSNGTHPAQRVTGRRTEHPQACGPDPFWQGDIQLACGVVDRIRKNRWIWGAPMRPFTSAWTAVGAFSCCPEAPASWPLGPALTALGNT